MIFFRNLPQIRFLVFIQRLERFSATKSVISQMTGLSIGTCNTILNELVAASKAFETEGDFTTAGRPPKAYTFNADFSHICCLYITHEDHQVIIHYAIVDLLGKILESGARKKDTIDSEIIISVIEELIHTDPLISRISTGIPGFLCDGKVKSVCLPVVCKDRDVNRKNMGEEKRQVISKSPASVYITLNSF